MTRFCLAKLFPIIPKDTYLSRDLTFTKSFFHSQYIYLPLNKCVMNLHIYHLAILELQEWENYIASYTLDTHYISSQVFVSSTFTFLIFWLPQPKGRFLYKGKESFNSFLVVSVNKIWENKLYWGIKRFLYIKVIQTLDQSKKNI